MQSPKPGSRAIPLAPSTRASVVTENARRDRVFFERTLIGQATGAVSTGSTYAKVTGTYRDLASRMRAPAGGNFRRNADAGVRESTALGGLPAAGAPTPRQPASGGGERSSGGRYRFGERRSAAAPVGAHEAQAEAGSGAGAGGRIGGDVYLDGNYVGRWIAAWLEQQATRPQSGFTGFDPRIGPVWPGALHGT